MPGNSDYLWGARAIAIAAGLYDEDGEPDEKGAYYLLENQLLPGTKIGRQWVSSQSRIDAALGNTAPVTT
jgi:hypothetical protein